jgi:cytochrome c-type biogenesis protein CcmE
MKTTHIILLVCIAAAMSLILVLAGDTSSYQTFKGAAVKKNDVQVVGQLVKSKDMSYDPQKDPNYFSFYMKDRDSAERQVVFIGARPQDFQRSEQLVCTGHIDGDKFICTKILMKCPSKYTNDKVNIAESKTTKS